MQWAYDVKGVTPEYQVPKVPSALFPSAGSFARTVKQRPKINFIRENLKLTTTAVSSPVKGMKMFGHIKSS